MKASKTAVLAVLMIGSMFATVNTQSHATETLAQKHPRRHEVLRRDHHEMHRSRVEGREIQADKGKLGGHYKQLEGENHRIERQEAAIKHQEQLDAARHGGHITKGEQARLNQEENHVKHEENHLQHQINQDSQH